MEIAKKKGLPLLKHHLLPRTKGFVHSVHGLRGKGKCWLATDRSAENQLPPVCCEQAAS